MENLIGVLWLCLWPIVIFAGWKFSLRNITKYGLEE